MPSYFDSLKTEERWALTDFVYSLGDGDEPGYSTVVVAAPLDEELDPARADALFQAAQPARFPLVGQIMEPGRAFAPSATSVQVRAVYDAQRIALQVRWHDVRADTTGPSGPALEVPLAEEAFAAGGEAAPAPEGDDFWGQQEEAPAGSAGSGSGSAPAAPASQDFWEQGGEQPAAMAPPAEFADAVALQWPLELPSGVAKPHFLFGDVRLGVDLWFLDLASRRLRQFVGRGSGALTALEASEAEGSGTYSDGEWSAFFVRDLRASSGVTFAEGAYVPIAFRSGTARARERGSRRGLTQWMYVYLQPREKPSVVVPMITAALIVLVLELLAVGAIRRRSRTRALVPVAPATAPRA